MKGQVPLRLSPQVRVLNPRLRLIRAAAAAHNRVAHRRILRVAVQNPHRAAVAHRAVAHRLNPAAVPRIQVARPQNPHPHPRILLRVAAPQILHLHLRNLRLHPQNRVAVLLSLHHPAARHRVAVLPHSRVVVRLNPQAAVRNPQARLIRVQVAQNPVVLRRILLRAAARHRVAVPHRRQAVVPRILQARRQNLRRVQIQVARHLDLRQVAARRIPVAPVLSRAAAVIQAARPRSPVAARRIPVRVRVLKQDKPFNLPGVTLGEWRKV